MTWTLGFTGTQYTGGYSDRILPMLELIPRFDRFVTGACVGFDEMAGIAMAVRFPTAEHVVLVPAERYKVATWWTEFSFVQVVEMPEGTTFKDRNQEIVNRSQMLAYCALFAEEHGASRRSGTWQTIRMARRNGVSIYPGSMIIRRDA